MRWAPWLVVAAAFLAATSVAAEREPALLLQSEFRVLQELDPARVVLAQGTRGDPSCAGAGESEARVGIGDTWIRFVETATENGCAEARWTVNVPEGAESLLVEFQATREVVHSSDPLRSAANLQQRMRVYLVDEQQFNTLADVAFFAADEDPRPSLVSFSYAVPVPREATYLVVAFYFHDAGFQAGGSLGVGQAYSSTMAAPTVSFMEVPAARPNVVVDRELRGGGQLAYPTRVEVDIPDLASGLRPWLELRVSNRYAVDVALAPGAVAVPSERLVVMESDGVLRLRLHPDVFDDYGSGLYAFTFVATENIEANPAMLPLAVGFLALPAVAGMYAQNKALPRREVERASRMGVILTLTTLWVLYGVILTIAMALGGLQLMSVWPLAPEAGLLYVGCILLAAAFAAMAWRQRRHDMRVLEQDLTELARMKKELERSNQALQEFATVASHDLREPLRMVAAYTQLLSRRYTGKLDADADEFIRYANEGAARMDSMIEDLLNYARVGRDRRHGQVDLGEVMEEVAQNLEGAIAACKARLHVSHLPVVHGDRTLLVQLFQNLVSNAIKFAGARQPLVRVSARRMGNGWELRVRDNGIGIPADKRGRIFELFQRLHARDKYPGNGIGLAMCRRIVEQVGGRIWVESTPGKGSTFIVLWPDEPHVEAAFAAADKRKYAAGRSATPQA
jgi:signal transduction histidine kinase